MREIARKLMPLKGNLHNQLLKAKTILETTKPKSPDDRWISFRQLSTCTLPTGSLLWVHDPKNMQMAVTWRVPNFAAYRCVHQYPDFTNHVLVYFVLVISVSIANEKRLSSSLLTMLAYHALASQLKFHSMVIFGHGCTLRAKNNFVPQSACPYNRK